jgi:hypothetical protein
MMSATALGMYLDQQAQEVLRVLREVGVLAQLLQQLLLILLGHDWVGEVVLHLREQDCWSTHAHLTCDICS